MPDKCFDHNSVANNSLKLSRTCPYSFFTGQVEERTRTTGDLILSIFYQTNAKNIAEIHKNNVFFREGTFFLEVFV